MTDVHLIEHRVSQEELLRGNFLHAFRDTVRLPNQALATREYVVHPGAVMVIPLLDTPDGLQVVLERQYRYPVGQVMIEFPAGKLDAGKTLGCVHNANCKKKPVTPHANGPGLESFTR